MASPKPELVAVYGRRRVGKTFTVSQTLKENPSAIYFEFTGSVLEDGRKQPLRDFLAAFQTAWYQWIRTQKTIRTVEDCLMALIDLSRMASAKTPLYLFLDELPWMARSAPRFFRGLSTLWNNALSKNPHLKLFIAGSATSWMIDHVVHARGGLAKRLTAQIHMRALDLAQTKQFLAEKGMPLSGNEIFRIYLALGGIPYYLDALDPRVSPAENLYNLVASRDGLLSVTTEYEELFRYLFARDSVYRKVIEALVRQKYGLTQTDLAWAVENRAKASSGLLKILKNLEYSDLIERRDLFLNRNKGVRYFVTDEYIRFISRWLKNMPAPDYGAFNEIFSSPAYRAWQGFDFELIAFKNSHLIAAALGISGISVRPHVYYQSGKIQIDLMLARGDRTITLCEAKSCDGEYEPTPQDVRCFHDRSNAIQDLLKRKRKPHQHINYCFIVRNGIKRNRYFNEINPLVVDLATVL